MSPAFSPLSQNFEWDVDGGVSRNVHVQYRDGNRRTIEN